MHYVQFADAHLKSIKCNVILLFVYAVHIRTWCIHVKAGTAPVTLYAHVVYTNRVYVTQRWYIHCRCIKFNMYVSRIGCTA